MPAVYPNPVSPYPKAAPRRREPPATVFSENETQGRMLVFRRDLCSGCGECIEVCPQRFLRPAPSAKRQVAWKASAIPEPEPRECAACKLCLPRARGGDQEEGKPPVLCPWRACTVCDLCTRACPDSAIYTVPIPVPECARETRPPLAEESA